MRPRIEPTAWAGRGIGLVLGLAGGWYGVATGFLLGAMVDALRSAGRLRGYLKAPDKVKPREEGLAGLWAAGALAIRANWPGGNADLAFRRRLLDTHATDILSVVDGSESLIGRLSLRITLHSLRRAADAAFDEEVDLAGLARDLASRGCEEARGLLADQAYALVAESRGISPGLAHAEADGIAGILADSGCSAEAIRDARHRYFPAYFDPWEILGLEVGASPDLVRKAYRAQSRRLHPDTRSADRKAARAFSGADGDEAFLRVKEAYEYLRARG